MSQEWKAAWKTVILCTITWFIAELLILGATGCNPYIHAAAIFGGAMFLWAYSVVSYNRSKELLKRVVELEQLVKMHG